MSRINKNNKQIEQSKANHYNQLPDSFEKAILKVQNFTFQEIKKETIQKQLYYHTWDHANAVKRRANIILQAIEPFWEKVCQSKGIEVDLKRMKQLIELCAIAHDMVQNFLTNTSVHTSRKRETGASETATITKLIGYIKELNRQLIEQKEYNFAIFTDSDIKIITEAIEATICLYDPSDNSIYQPDLYDGNKNLSIPAQIIALADLGSLGMEGINSYFQEGSLIFLEENPDIVPLLINKIANKLDINSLDQEQQELWENVRQRLLRRARFQINFARGRKARLERELQGLPTEFISILRDKVFKYLNQETIQEIELLTPTEDDTKLEKLIDFFELVKYLK